MFIYAFTWTEFAQQLAAGIRGAPRDDGARERGALHVRLARDPLLRSTAPYVLSLEMGELDRAEQELKQALANGKKDSNGIYYYLAQLSEAKKQDAAALQSYLKVDAIAIEPGLVTLQFVAVSNKTYSVQWKQSVEAGLWQSFINVSGGDRSMTVTVTDPQPPVSGRIYRLVTPRLP